MKMNSNLMSSAREDLAKNECPTARFLDDFKLCLSRSPPLDYSHFLSVHRMAANGLKNFAGWRGELPDAQRQVEFLNLASGKLPAQSQMGQVVLGNHKTTAGFFIKSMHHSRSKLAADATQVFDMMKERINQCARLHTSSRMNHHPSRFVDDQQMFVLEENGQRKILGPQVHRFRFRFRNRYFVSCANDLFGAASGPVEQDAAR
jgi:hypothetical protein